MKRFFCLFLFLALFVAGCSENDAIAEEDGAGEGKTPRVTTAEVTEYGPQTALLGGSVADMDLASATRVGVRYVAWADGASTDVDWTSAQSWTTEPAASWSVVIEGLTPGTRYAVMAFVKTASAEYSGGGVFFTTDPADVKTPEVTTADVTDYDATSALLGGAMSGVEVAELAQAGVQYVVWGEDVPTIGSLDWSNATELTTDPAASWSLRATGLANQTQYAARAFVSFSGRRFYAEPKSFYTYSAERAPLTVAELRLRHAASEDVSSESVRGYVALSIAHNCHSESFAAGTVILYDNTGSVASALTLFGGASEDGLGAAGLQQGDYVEVSLAGAVRDLYKGMIPQYTDIARDMVRVISRGHAIDPVWATPAQLNASATDYLCSPVRISRVYAQTPGVLFSSAENWYTDGESRFTVYSKAGSVVGLLQQNSATATLAGICSYFDKMQVIPMTAADVAGFTGPDNVTEGTPAIELLRTEYYEFVPQGGTLEVECAVTRREGLRLFADMDNVDQSRYSVDIEGDRVSITARANTTGVTDGHKNCYLYLSETKEGRREATATLRITQLSSVYESLPGLIQANGGELSSVHDAVVNGVAVKAMKLGSGSYTGHYTSDPMCVRGTKRLQFYAVGWAESKHEAATLYLRVEQGGAASVRAIPLTIHAGATGIAPFKLDVDASSRYEVTLSDLTPGSVVSFSTSPDFTKKSDDRTGRALLFGVQVRE